MQYWSVLYLLQAMTTNSLRKPVPIHSTTPGVILQSCFLLYLTVSPVTDQMCTLDAYSWLHAPATQHCLCTCVSLHENVQMHIHLQYDIVQYSPLAACVECTRLISKVGTHTGILLINIPVIPQYTLRVLVFGGTIIQQILASKQYVCNNWQPLQYVSKIRI